MPVENEDSRSAGEGDSHTARAHITEESDSGVVLMKRLNNAGQTAAEGVEGRPLIKENTHQSGTHPTQSGARVSQGLVGVRKAARDGRERKFTALPLSRVSLRRQISEIGAVCANERSYGSVRGVPGDWYPYRDRLN